MAVASGVIGPDAAGGDELRHAQVEVGGAGRRLLPEHARGRGPLRPRRVAAAEDQLGPVAQVERDAVVPPPQLLGAGAQLGRRGGGDGERGERRACPAPGRRRAGALLTIVGRSSARTPVRTSPEPVAGTRLPPLSTAATGACSITSIRRSCGKSGRIRRSATEVNGLTASRSACASTCRVLMPSATDVRASRTCSDSELVLPVIETCSTLANEESRNHRPPSAEPDERAGQTGEHAPWEPWERGPSLWMFAAGAAAPTRRRAPGRARRRRPRRA